MSQEPSAETQQLSSPWLPLATYEPPLSALLLLILKRLSVSVACACSSSRSLVRSRSRSQPVSLSSTDPEPLTALPSAVFYGC